MSTQSFIIRTVTFLCRTAAACSDNDDRRVSRLILKAQTRKQRPESTIRFSDTPRLLPSGRHYPLLHTEPFCENLFSHTHIPT